MTYDESADVLELARAHDFDVKRIPMKNTHHDCKNELFITRRVGGAVSHPGDELLVQPLLHIRSDLIPGFSTLSRLRFNRAGSETALTLVFAPARPPEPS